MQAVCNFVEITKNSFNSLIDWFMGLERKLKS